MTRRRNLGAVLALVPELAVEFGRQIEGEVMALLFGLRRGERAGEAAADRQRRLAGYVQIERQVRIITRDPEALRALGDAVNALVQQARPTALAWIDLTEDLVQEASRLYGWSPAASGYKKAQVRAALLQVLKAHDELLLPNVWEPLRPFAFAYVIDSTIEVIVGFLNQSDLWQSEPSAPAPVTAAKRARGLVDRLTTFLAKLAWRLSPAEDLDPRFAAAVARMQFSPEQFAGNLTTLAAALNRNRSALNAFLNLLTAATHEAERFLDLDGPAKKEYVTDVLLDFIYPDADDMDPSGAEYNLVRAMIGFAIDAAVLIFDRRGRFSHSLAAHGGNDSMRPAFSQ